MASAHSDLRPPAVERDRRWLQFLLCCYVAIFGVRAFLVEKFAASVAWGDDLDGIARRILLPWENGTLTLSALFATHNGDHRILATRLWEILWYELNGSWDPKLVMVTKALIFAGAATIFIHVFAGALARWRFVAGGALAVLFAFPFAFANLIWAFQSQFDFFLLAAALGWWALLEGKVLAALTVAASALLMLGSGPVIAASFVPFFGVMWLEKRWPARKAAACCAAAGVIVALGLASPTDDAPPHTGTVPEKAVTAVRIFAWPHSNLLSIVERLPESARYVPAKLLHFPSAERSWLMAAADVLHAHPALVLGINAAGALLVLGPVLLVAWGVVRRRIPLAVAAGPLGLACFAGLMIAATAAARANQITIAPRYLDHVALAGFASVACAFLLLARDPGLRRRVLLWGAIMGAGYAATMVITLAQLSRRTPDASLAVLQRYYATTPHNHAAMTEGEAFRRFIVSDDPTQFMSELDEPGMERVMPRAVTAPGSAPGPAAAVAQWIGRLGLVIAGVAALLAVLVAYRWRRASAYASPVAMPAAPA